MIGKIPYLLLLIVFCYSGCCYSDNIVLKSNSGLFYCDFNVQTPDSQGVLKSFILELPEYQSGIYWAQDNFYSYWQVNGNRVLPWYFESGKIKELFSSPAYGVDSKTNQQFRSAAINDRTRYVDRYGSFLQLKLIDNRVMSILPLAYPGVVSWLHVDKNGTICIETGSYGKDAVSGKMPVVAWAVGNSSNESAWKLFSSLRKNKTYSDTFRMRFEKKYPEIFEYLGWCTWEEYKRNISEKILIPEIKKLKELPLPVRYAIIDDGHLSSSSGDVKQEHQLSSFSPNEKFPEGFAPLLNMRDKDGLRWMGLWLNFNGYWGGFSPNNDFGEEINNCLVTIPESGYTVPVNNKESIKKVYTSLLGQPASEGFDFLKIDWQASNIYQLRHSQNAAYQAFATSRIVDNLSHDLFSDVVINCMAMNNIVLLNTFNVNITRTSIDYKLNNMFMAKEHLLQSYHNALYMCPTVWGDHDMFHSSDPVCGEIMALSKAVSGGPVYLSDAPENIVSEMVWPLCYNDGRLLRPLAPAVALNRSVFSSPLIDGNAYYVSAPLNNNAAAIIAYNLNVDSMKVIGAIDKNDYAQTGALIQPYSGEWKAPQEGLYVFDYFAQTGQPLVNKYQFEIKDFGHKFFILLPIVKGWVMIGRIDKYLSPAAIENLIYDESSISFTMYESGPLVFWLKDGKPKGDGFDIVPLADGLWMADIKPGLRDYRTTIMK